MNIALVYTVLDCYFRDSVKRSFYIKGSDPIMDLCHLHARKKLISALDRLIPRKEFFVSDF